MLTWHIITGEYPPVFGGVSDYSHLVAEGLAGAGDEVHVWCPPSPELDACEGVTVHRSLGRLSPRDLRAVDRLLDRFPAPRRLLVQWVPHSFGYRSLNVAFCLWLWRRARRGDRVEIMVHEPYLAFGEGAVLWTAAAAVHRLMTAILLRAACRIWIAIPDWERRWRPYALGRDIPFAWLPVPSSLRPPGSTAVSHVRDRFGTSDGAIIGHLGSYGAAAQRALSTSLPEILRRSPHAVVLLLGRNGASLREVLVRAHPSLAARTHAVGVLEPAALAAHVAACDVLVQPYPDGITSRRTSAMAGLALGVPVVSTAGRLTEPLWAETEGVVLAGVDDSHGLAAETLRLLADERSRRELGARGRDLYARRFDVSHTICALRGAARQACESPS